MESTRPDSVGAILVEAQRHVGPLCDGIVTALQLADEREIPRDVLIAAIDDALFELEALRRSLG